MDDPLKSVFAKIMQHYLNGKLRGETSIPGSSSDPRAELGWFWTRSFVIYHQCRGTSERTRRIPGICLIPFFKILIVYCTLYRIGLPIDEPHPKWEDWNGPLTSDIEDIISTFLASLLNQPSIPPSAILISQLGLASGGNFLGTNHVIHFILASNPRPLAKPLMIRNAA